MSIGNFAKCIWLATPTVGFRPLVDFNVLMGLFKDGILRYPHQPCRYTQPLALRTTSFSTVIQVHRFLA